MSDTTFEKRRNAFMAGYNGRQLDKPDFYEQDAWNDGVFAKTKGRGLPFFAYQQESKYGKYWRDEPVKDSAYWHKEVLRIERQRNCVDTAELQLEWRQAMDSWKLALDREAKKLSEAVTAVEFREKLGEQMKNDVFHWDAAAQQWRLESKAQ